MGSVTRVAKNTILLSVSSVIGAFFSFILAIVIARYLGASDFGNYSFVFAFIAIFDIFFDSGISLLVMREVARNTLEVQKYIRDALAAKVAVTIAAFAALLGVAVFAGYPQQVAVSLVVIGAAYVLLSFVKLFLSFFKAFELMQYEAYLNVLERAAVLGGVWLLTMRNAGLVEIMMVFLAVACVKFAITLLLLVRRFGAITLPRLQDAASSAKLIRLAFPFALAAIFSTAYFNVDMLLIAFFKASSDVGLYNVAYRFVYAIAFLPNTFVVALLPLLSRLYVSSKDTLRFAYEKAFKYILLLALPAAVGGSILAYRIIHFFYGEEYAAAAPALQVLAWAGGIVFISLLCNAMMTALNLQKKNAALALGNLVVNVVLDVLLIPAYGIIGAGYATIAAELFGMLGATWLIHREIKPKLRPAWFFKAVAATAVMAFAVLSIGNSLLLLPTFAVGVAAYFASIALLGYFSEDDQKMMLAIFNASVSKMRALGEKHSGKSN